MEDPVVASAKNRERKAKHPVFEFRGTRYYWKRHGRGGYYKAVPGDYLHRDVWRATRGAIPAGHDVHHVDEDARNNRLSNLELLPEDVHRRLHMLQPARRTVSARTVVQFGVPAAARWRRDHPEEARVLGVRAAVASWQGKKPVEFRCEHCGKQAFMFFSSRSRFCGPNCRSDWRRKSGKDDITRTCVVCECSFKVNRYSGKVACSRACGSKLTLRTRLQRHGY